MSDITTIARPYAKAVFEIALASKQLAGWSEHLAALAEVLRLPDVIQFIGNPSVTILAQVELLAGILTHFKSQFKHDVDADLIYALIHLLADNKRLQLLPEMSVQFDALRAEQEKTLVVKVCSYSDLSVDQQQRLIGTLSERLKRQVALDIIIDKTLLGGALIQAGDVVIDGSVRGQLLKLANNLAA